MPVRQHAMLENVRKIAYVTCSHVTGQCQLATGRLSEFSSMTFTLCVGFVKNDD